MKQLLFLPFVSLGIFSVPHSSSSVTAPISIQPATHLIIEPREGLRIGTQAQQGKEKMSAAVFKNQQYCRAELKDFEWDVQYSIVSANVYFTGANFKTAAMGYITSSSLKPVSSLMGRCVPGSIVVFDDVKVMGPDKTVRSIQGVSFVLY